jgi:hypothetical protein
MSLSASIPLLARNEGVWEGYYRYYDPSGVQVDEHRSRLLCRIIDDRDYHQTNVYRWADGRRENREFPAEIRGPRLVFTNEITGWAQAVDLDEHGRTLMLHWTRNGEPDLYLYEMIQLSGSCPGTGSATTVRIPPLRSSPGRWTEIAMEDLR